MEDLPPDPAAQVHPLDRVIEALMALLIVAGPAAWGVVHAWTFQIVQTIVTIMVVLLLVRLALQRRRVPVASWTYLPMVLMLGWAALQMLPLPRSVVALASPTAASLWTEVLGEFATWMPLSVYPLQTERTFAVLLTASTVFVVAANVYRTWQQAARLLAVVVLVGAAVAGLGIVQSFVGGERVYWITPPVHGNSGPFMNHNHFAHFLNHSIAAALALLLLGSGKGWRVAARVVLIGYMLLAAWSVALSTSRGGFGALVVAGVVGAVMLQRNMRGASRGLAALLIAGTLVGGAAFYFAGGGALERISRFSVADEMDSERLAIWSGAIRTITKFPLTGAGLGTFEFIYPMSAEFTRHRVTHADNDYLQLLAETGIIGAALVAAFVALLGMTVWRIYRLTEQPPLQRVALVLALAILAALLQEATDFAQRLPGIAVMTAAFAGIILAADAATRPAATLRSPPRAAFAAGLLALLGVFAWTLAAGERDRRAEDLWNIAEVRREELIEQRWAGPNSQYAALVAPAAEAVRIQPHDVKYQYWLAVFRWRSISRNRDERGYVITTERTREITRLITSDLLRIPTYCASYAAPWLLAARLELQVLDDPLGRLHAERAKRRDPDNAQTDALLGP